MRKYLLFGLALAVLVGGAQAQPKDGDLIVSQFRDPTQVNTYGPGGIFSINPSTGVVFTIVQNLMTIGTVITGPNWLEMASDNTNFMVAFIPRGASTNAVGKGLYLHTVNTKGGVIRTLVADPNPLSTLDYINGFDLDGDGTWIMGGGYGVWSFDENTLNYGTITSSSSSTKGQINALCINRAAGGPEIVLGLFNIATSTNPFLTGIDRAGKGTTLVAQGGGGPSYVSAVRMDWYTGDYICTGFGIDANGGGGEFVSVSPKGKLTSLNAKTTMYRANGLYLDKQRMAYVLTYDWQTSPIPTLADNYLCAIYKMDLSGNFVSMYTYHPQLKRKRMAPSSITEYGSRHVVCNGTGKPGSVVAVRFSSRKAIDAGKPYQLAASFGYVGGPRMPNGEFLDLSFDGLFLATVQNLLPTVFRNFVGKLDASGNAAASVAIPPTLPANLGIAVFVSGIVVDPKAPGGVSTVGNTHWFVLN